MGVSRAFSSRSAAGRAPMHAPTCAQGLHGAPREAVTGQIDPRWTIIKGDRQKPVRRANF